MTVIVGFDTETTGLDPAEHRFVEVYAGLYGMDGRKMDEFHRRIDPERAISLEAQRVHGISAHDLIGAPKWREVASELVAFLDRGDLIVAHNGKEFDLPFLNSELVRIGLPVCRKPLVDTMTQARWATPIGKLPNLGELCFALDVAYNTSKAHKADYDVDVMVQCFFRGVQWGFYQLPELEAPAEAIAA